MEAYDINSLIEFLRFPSVSADKQFKPQVEACADWLLQRFKKAGLDAEKHPTGGNPVVLARNDHKSGRKTVLIYGHYDVQPPDPLELWQTPPFEPEIRDGRIFARGSSDNKGQIFAHLIGVEKSLQSRGGLMVSLLFLCWTTAVRLPVIAGVNVGLVAIALNFTVVGLVSLAGLTFRSRRKPSNGKTFYTNARE